MDLHTTIIGNLTDDPELRFTPSGVAVAKLTIAHNPRVRKGDEWTDGEPTFFVGTAWRQLAENVAESLTKGARVIATGRLRTERWEDKANGEKRSRIVLDLDGIGPDLAWATATVKKMARTSSPGDDEWNSASRQRPNPAPGSSLAPGTRPAAPAEVDPWATDEPPF